MMSYYDCNSIDKALLHLFPDIGLDVAKFRVYQCMSYSLLKSSPFPSVCSPSHSLFYLFIYTALWRKADNRRRFFETYAQQNGFDPRIAENWYAQQKDKVMTLKVLPPNLPLLLHIPLVIHISSRGSHLLALCLCCVQGAHGVLAYHGHSLSRALLDLFPNIGLDKHKFHVRKCTISSHHSRSLAHAITYSLAPVAWDLISNRRRFLEKYARDRGFDPLLPSGWYAQSCAQFTAIKVC